MENYKAGLAPVEQALYTMEKLQNRPCALWKGIKTSLVHCTPWKYTEQDRYVMEWYKTGLYTMEVYKTGLVHLVLVLAPAHLMEVVAVVGVVGSVKY